MNLNDVRFQRQNGGLARPVAGEDHVSGLLFFSDDKPSGFANDDVLQIVDIDDAEDKGILTDKSDETKASGGNVEITTAGAAAAINTITMSGTVLGSYTVQTGDDAADVATGLRAAINALTSTHGYVAAGSGANVALTPPAGLGDSINGGTHLAFASTGTGAATVTQFSDGVDAFFDVIHYHIDEFFRLNPGATLYVGIYDVPDDYDFTELETMQRYAAGKIRQFGVYMKDEAFDTDHLTAIQAVREDMDAEHMPFVALYAADITGLSPFADLRALTNNGVAAVIGQDGDNTGAALYVEKGYSITCLGATLGALSLAKVSENIGWVGKFNMASVELDVPALADGTLMSTLSEAAMAVYHTKGYIFLRKYIGRAGSYFNDDHTATPVTDDYAYLCNTRTMDKAIRGVYQFLLPQVNGPVKVDASSGKLDPDFIAYMEQLGNRHLEQMERDGELSGYKVTINPDQNLLADSTLNISIGNVPIGVSRNLAIKIGFVPSV